jgi:nucleotide sugar dehydrogenase
MSKSIFIVGSGLVGQATGKVLGRKRFNVTFVDTNPAVVSQLRREGYQAFEVEELQKTDADIFMLSVPTYLSKQTENGLDHVKAASTALGRWLSNTKDYCLVAIRSSVLPGTTEDIIIPILEEYSGRKAGGGFGVCVQPEYLRERRPEVDVNNPWLIVIGELDKRSGDWLQEVYHWVSCPIYRVSLREAEMQKFVHNLCNANKISFFNEIRLVCQQIGVDCERIFPLVAQSAEAIWNPLYGTRDLGPFGGSCLPKDVVAFLSWAKQQGMETPVMDAVLKVNQAFEKRPVPALSKVPLNYPW